MNPPRQRLFWAISIGHLVNDIFTSLGPVLLAFLSAHLMPISNTQIGAAVSAQQFAAAVSQPLFGWLIDRGGARWERWLGAGGVAWTAGFLLLSVLAATTGQFGLMVVPYAIAALGSGAFHPVGTKIVGESNPQHTASSMSYFFLMGQSGSALGPVLAGLLLDSANPAGTTQVTLLPMFALGLLAVPTVGWMAASMTGRLQAASGSTTSQPAAKASRVSLPVKALIILALMVTLRSLAQPGSVAFIPRLFQQKGWDASEYGLITSLFWVASGIAGILFGQLADRYDRRWVIAGSLLLSVPALFFLPIAESRPMVFGLAIAAGGLTGGSHSVIVALAQSLIPGSRGFVSGATLGFIFGAGAIGGLLIGGLSDRFGLGMAFQIVAGFTILAGLLALLLPAGRQVSAAIPPEMETALTRAR